MRLSLRNLYQNLFSDLDLEHPDPIFRLERFYTSYELAFITTMVNTVNLLMSHVWIGHLKSFELSRLNFLKITRNFVKCVNLSDVSLSGITVCQIWFPVILNLIGTTFWIPLQMRAWTSIFNNLIPGHMTSSAK